MTPASRERPCMKTLAPPFPSLRVSKSNGEREGASQLPWRRAPARPQPRDALNVLIRT